MYIKKSSNKLIDVFIDVNEDVITGFEPTAWLRLAYKDGKWLQVAGVRLPSWQFKKLTSELEK